MPPNLYLTPKYFSAVLTNEYLFVPGNINGQDVLLVVVHEKYDRDKIKIRRTAGTLLIIFLIIFNKFDLKISFILKNAHQIPV